MCLYPLNLRRGFDKWQTVGCGQCVECLDKYSTEWAVRCTLEASLHKENCMITLTYAQEPREGVSRRDLQLFMKRLRKAIYPATVRFFACGEYGSLKGRPHYHVILFGYRFPDAYYFFTDKKGHPVYRSSLLERLWTSGFSSMSEVNFDTCKYSAKYLQKLFDPGEDRNPAFTAMSLKPGLGYAAFQPKWLLSDKIYIRGKAYRVPRYFLKKEEEKDPRALDVIRSKRQYHMDLYVEMHNSRDLVSARRRVYERLGVPAKLFRKKRTNLPLKKLDGTVRDVVSYMRDVVDVSFAFPKSNIMRC